MIKNNNDGHYDEVRKILEISEDEPIFVIRAQDQVAISALASYLGHAKGAGASKEFLADLANTNMDFSGWRVRNPQKIKIPD